MSFGTGMKIGAGIACGGCFMIVLVIGGLFYMGERWVEEVRERRLRPKSNTVLEPSGAPATTPTWMYSENPEPMGRGLVKRADLESVNTVNFDFPYQGEQRATLTIRKHPKYGKDIILSVEKGHLLVGIDDCTVHVRFDEGKPLAYSASGPEDRSTTSLFLRNYPSFVASARKAHKIFIQAPFYQHGEQVFEFRCCGLVWE